MLTVNRHQRRDQAYGDVDRRTSPRPIGATPSSVFHPIIRRGAVVHVVALAEVRKFPGCLGRRLPSYFFASLSITLADSTGLAMMSYVNASGRARRSVGTVKALFVKSLALCSTCLSSLTYSFRSWNRSLCTRAQKRIRLRGSSSQRLTSPRILATGAFGGRSGAGGMVDCVWRGRTLRMHHRESVPNACVPCILKYCPQVLGHAAWRQAQDDETRPSAFGPRARLERFSLCNVCSLPQTSYEHFLTTLS